MPRPNLAPHLVPRQPKTVLGWTMQKLRMANGWTGKRTAQVFGCSAAHISRIERGATPSRELVQFYEETFGGDQMLMSLFEVVVHAREQERRRWGGSRPQAYRALPGDGSMFVGDTVPHGTLMRPGEVFEKSWQVRNSGSAAWKGRRLERQGPQTGPGLITSARFIDIPDTEAGDVAEIKTLLKAPTYDCTSVAYFKMVHADGKLCFPDNYQLGLDVLVMVRGQKPDEPGLLEA